MSLSVEQIEKKWHITGIVGIIAGFISGKNAADQAKQQSEAAAGATK